MTYIYELPDWPHFRWDAEKISPLLSWVRHHQGRLLGGMSSLGFDAQTEASVSNLVQNIVKSSAIEGEILNLEEVRSSIARRMGLDIGGIIPSSRHVEAVVDMMLDATQNYEEPLTFERLFSWQSALFPEGRSGFHRITTGAFRQKGSDPMQVVSGPIGREKVHFEAPSSEKLEYEMGLFIQWFNQKEDPLKLDPLIKAAIAHFWFVTLHPFEDGNGRIARAIGDLALARTDQSHLRFYSLSSQIETERKNYYEILEKQQKRNLDITLWLEWFMGCLHRSLLESESLLSNILYKAKLWQWIKEKPDFHLNSRQILILNKLLGDFEGLLNTSKYAKLAKCSSDTALRDIQELTQQGILILNPQGGRSTNYQLISPDELALHINLKIFQTKI
jgi:Fic family protein